MDLIEYLTSYKKKIKTRKKIRKSRIPRRGRGFGQRGSKYNSSKSQNTRDNIDKQLLALLTILTKQNQSKIDISNPEALNPFVERDRQLYTMTNNKVQKSIDLPTEESSKITENTQKALIFNISQDLDMKVNEILEDQQELLTELKAVDVISPELAKEVRLKNLQLKENVLSQTVRTQELINEAEDLNDYRDIIQKQNKMIDNTTKGFVEIDNQLSERQVKQIEELQNATDFFKQVGGITDENIINRVRIQDQEEEIRTLKLTLEKNELKEQKLKQRLTQMESIIDKSESSALQEAERYLAERN
mgnify:CR=1 FL=1